MDRIWLSFLAILICTPVSGQNFETYYESGALQSRTPLNEWGEFEGMGEEYYEDGTLAARVPYFAGKVNGIVEEYYPQGHIKLRHSFMDGRKNGKMFLFRPDGTLSMMAWMEADSVVFSQQYNTRGKLVDERVGYFDQPIDTAEMGKPVMWLAEGTKLKAGESNLAQVFIKGFPSSFIDYACSDCIIESSGRADFPLLITPHQPGQLTIYLRLKLHSRAQAGDLKLITFEVE